jgi:hypothetical protein
MISRMRIVIENAEKIPGTRVALDNQDRLGEKGRP